MTDYSSLFLLLWLIPVTLQILLPLVMFCGWTVSRVVSSPAREHTREQEEEASALAAVAN